MGLHGSYNQQYILYNEEYYNGFQSLQDYQQSIRRHQEYQDQRIQKTQQQANSVSENSSDYPFNDVIDVYRQNFDSEGDLDYNQSPQHYQQPSPQPYDQPYQPHHEEISSNYNSNGPQPQYSTALASPSSFQSPYPALDQQIYSQRLTADNGVLKNEAYASIFSDTPGVTSSTYLTSLYSGLYADALYSRQLPIYPNFDSYRYQNSPDLQNTYTNPIDVDHDTDYYSTNENTESYDKKSSNLSRLVDLAFSPTAARFKGNTVDIQPMVYDEAQIEALAEYTNQVIDLVDSKEPNKSYLSDSVYETAVEDGDHSRTNGRAPPKPLSNHGAQNIPGAFTVASSAVSDGKLSSARPLSLPQTTVRPLGPRKPPPTVTGSPDKTTGPRFSSYSFQKVNTTIQSQGSPLSSPVSATKVKSYHQSTSEMRSQEVYHQTYEVKEEPQPTLDQPSSTLQNELNNVKAQVNRLARQPKFIEKQNDKTVLVENKSKVKMVLYSQSMKTYKKEDGPKIKPLKKTATWTDSQTTQDLMKEDKRNSKLPPVPSLDLPSLPFSSSSLTDSQLKQCIDLWSLSKLLEWCKLLRIWFKDALIPKEELVKSLAALVRHRYSKLSKSLIEDNVDTIIEDFERNNCIYFKNISSNNENDLSASVSSSTCLYVFFNDSAQISGVLPELSSCYSTKLNHRKTSSNKAIMKEYTCYALHCPRELSKKVCSAYSQPAKAQRVITAPTGLKHNGESEIGDSWAEHWNITKEELDEMDNATRQRQSHMFDLIKAEQRVVNHGRLILDVYGKSYLQQNPPLLPASDNFYQNACQTVEPIVRIHQEKLLEPLIAKLKQGKYMTGVADLYSNWVHEAYMPYLKYVEKMVSVRELIDRESNIKNSRFMAWIDKFDTDPRVMAFRVDRGRLFRNNFLVAAMNIPITLAAIQDNTSPTDPEYKRLEKALKSVKKLINKLNTMQAHAVRNRTLINLSNSLIWKNGTETNLEWESQDRRVIKRGQVSKKREMWLNSYSHLILLDNYLLITDEIKDSPTLKKYRVSEKPIAMRFLLVETDIATTRKQEQVVVGPKKAATTSSEVNTDSQDPVIYPFKVRHIARELSFTFYTNSVSERSEWLEAFKETQSKYYELERLHEPFKLKVISDAAFAYDKDDIPHKLPIFPANSAIDIALQEVRNQFPTQLPRPLMYSKTATASTFTYEGKDFVVIGLGYGVFLSDASEIRNWKRVLELKNVTQLKVLEEFNLLIVLADKILQYYKLDSIFTVYKGIRNKTIGQKLSKQYVSFFKVGQQKGSTLLFYCKQKVSSSGCYFKVMVPKLDDASNSFEYFEEYRKFNIQAECFDLTIFNNTFAIHTVKGFEILSLSILQPQSIPILIDLMSGAKLDNGNVEVIKKKLNLASCKPMGLYKINDNKELLLVYNEFAIICNNHGVLSRYNILQFTLKCNRVAFQDDLLIIIGKNIIEIFKIDNSTCIPGSITKPVQVISGKEITLIDSTSGKIKFSILHPIELGRQLVVELAPNEYYNI